MQEVLVAVIRCSDTHPLITPDVVGDAHTASVQDRAQEVLVAVVRCSEQQPVLLPRLEAHGDVVCVRGPRGTDSDPDIVVTTERHDLRGCKPNKKIHW